MSKYVIKNCPATYQNFKDKFVCTSQVKEKGFPFYCQDCTDCLLKRIVEKLKNPNNCRYSGRPLVFTADLLQLIDVQECE